MASAEDEVRQGGTGARRNSPARDRLVYLEAGLATQLALRDAIKRLTGRGFEAGRPLQDRHFLARVQRIQRAVDDIHDDLRAYLTTDSRLRPLGSVAAEVIRGRAHLLSGLPANTAPNEILAIAGDLIESWKISRWQDDEATDPEIEDVIDLAVEEAEDPRAQPPGVEASLGKARQG